MIGMGSNMQRLQEAMKNKKLLPFKPELHLAHSTFLKYQKTQAPADLLMSHQAMRSKLQPNPLMKCQPW
jgi:hypothetical protein|tara:strand:- start:1618 stop:1824 length:207 start_codon:yes stop_codon:yes gene_type:complete